MDSPMGGPSWSRSVSPTWTVMVLPLLAGVIWTTLPFGTGVVEVVAGMARSAHAVAMTATRITPATGRGRASQLALTAIMSLDRGMPPERFPANLGWSPAPARRQWFDHDDPVPRRGPRARHRGGTGGPDRRGPHGVGRRLDPARPRPAGPCPLSSPTDR